MPWSILGGRTHFTALESQQHGRAEIWDPATESFTLLDARHRVARTYHSSAVLMADGRVFTGGGGLCHSCDVNHLDAEIFSPPYLFNSDGSLARRPSIFLFQDSVQLGSSFRIRGSQRFSIVSLIRYGSATHSTDTDQRRIELCGFRTRRCRGNDLTLTVPSDPGIAIRGNWMVFGVNFAGVPSVSRNLLLT